MALKPAIFVSFADNQLVVKSGANARDSQEMTPELMTAITACKGKGKARDNDRFPGQWIVVGSTLIVILDAEAHRALNA